MDTTKVESVNSGLGAYEGLVQYGALGIVVLALGYAAWYMFKRNLEEKDRMQKRIEELERALLEKNSK